MYSSNAIKISWLMFNESNLQALNGQYLQSSSEKQKHFPYLQRKKRGVTFPICPLNDVSQHVSVSSGLCFIKSMLWKTPEAEILLSLSEPLIASANCSGLPLRQESSPTKGTHRRLARRRAMQIAGRGAEITSKISTVRGHLRADGSDGFCHVCGSINFNSPAVLKNSLDCSRVGSHFKPGLFALTADAARREGQTTRLCSSNRVLAWGIMELLINVCKRWSSTCEYREQNVSECFMHWFDGPMYIKFGLIYDFCDGNSLTYNPYMH